MIETFDHDADLGLVVTAPSWKELMEEAVRGMWGIIVDPASVIGRDRLRISAEGDGTEDLLWNLLSEALSLPLSRSFAVKDVSVGEADHRRVSAFVIGEEFDPSRHEFGSEIKAVTLHGFSVRSDGGIYRAEVLFDV